MPGQDACSQGAGGASSPIDAHSFGSRSTSQELHQYCTESCRAKEYATTTQVTVRRWRQSVVQASQP